METFSPKTILFGLVLLVVPAWAGTIGFENTEGFAAKADISKTKEWAGSTPGVGLVSTAVFHGGSQSLELLPGDGVVKFAFPPTKETVVFVDLYIRPAADTSAEPQYTVEANGAKLAFLAKEGDDAQGTVVAVTDASKPAVPTGHDFDLDDSSRATDWMRVTIREDLASGVWDLFLDGELCLINQPLPASEASATVAFYSNPAVDSFVDDLSVGVTNPLFPDADKDGMPDAMEAVMGSNPLVADRQSSVDGTTYLQRFAGLGKKSIASLSEENGRRFVYIDNQNGSDQNSGEFSYRMSGRGPKASLKALVPTGAANCTVVLMPSPVPYVCPDFSPGQAPDLKISDQGSVTLTTEN